MKKEILSALVTKEITDETLVKGILEDIERWEKEFVSNLYLYWQLAEAGATESIAYLIDCVKEEDKFEKTFSFVIFMNTLRKKLYPVLDVLLEKGYNINRKDALGKTIVFYLEEMDEAEFFTKHEAKMNEVLNDEYRGRSFELLVK